MTSYIQADESWIHEASEKALEQLRLRWKERVDTWVAKVNYERSKPRWFGLVKGLEPTLDMKVLKEYGYEQSLLFTDFRFKQDESRLLTLINATNGLPNYNNALLSIEDSALINKYTRG